MQSSRFVIYAILIWTLIGLLNMIRGKLLSSTLLYGGSVLLTLRIPSGGRPGKPSVAGVEPCSGGYWAMFVLTIVVILVRVCLFNS